MAWQDRPYYRDPTPSSRLTPLLWLASGSVPLFTAFAIRVRMHALMVVYIGLQLALSSTPLGIGPRNALTSMAILFVSVLLHEFGHCFGARAVGGQAEDIMMWPLGGLAFSRPPHRPWPSFITTAAGPAVTLGLCVVTGTLLAVMGHADRLPWFPFLHRNGILDYIPYGSAAYYVWWVFTVNYGLLLFNLLLLFYPFDGGRMVQELLWVRLGYYRSMQIAMPIGLVGAVCVGAFGLAFWDWNLALIGLFGFYTCHRQRQMLREMGPDAFEDEQGGLYAAAYEPATPRGRRRAGQSRWAAWAGRRAAVKARRDVVAAADEARQVDAILAKVSRTGMASLTRGERRTLRRATAARRRRDMSAA